MGRLRLIVTTILLVLALCGIGATEHKHSVHTAVVPRARVEPASEAGLNRHVPLVAPIAPSAPTSRIALLHMFDGVTFFRRLGTLTGANKARYAARHGYDMVTRTPHGVSGLYREGNCPAGASPPCWVDDTDFDIDHSRRPTFGKIQLALAACNNRPNSWLLWSDADAMIVNQSIPLENIIDDGYDIMLSYDWLMVQAGVIFLKCSPWTISFLKRTYDDRQFDKARALDQSAIQAYLDKLSTSEHDQHVKVIPKYAINVYLEEYRPGDFLIHMAGKLYEATEPGLWAIANQFDVLSTVDDIVDIAAFFNTKYFLNYYSGVCPVGPRERQSSCKPDDERRYKLKEPLEAMSTPNRYRHVALRYYFIPNWQDKYDVRNWNDRRKVLTTSVPANHDESNLPGPPLLSEKNRAIHLAKVKTRNHDEIRSSEQTGLKGKLDGNRVRFSKARTASESSSIFSYFVVIVFLIVVPGVFGLALVWTRRRKFRDFKRR